MSSAGMADADGRIRTDFNHVRQSIATILSTPIGSRVMRREFGSELFRLIDRPFSDQVILAVYSAVVLAIARWEPRYEITNLNIRRADATGQLEIEVRGTYFPRGHLGDRSIREERVAVIDLGGALMQ